MYLAGLKVRYQNLSCYPSGFYTLGLTMHLLCQICRTIILWANSKHRGQVSLTKLTEGHVTWRCGWIPSSCPCIWPGGNHWDPIVSEPVVFTNLQSVIISHSKYRHRAFRVGTHQPTNHLFQHCSPCLTECHSIIHVVIITISQCEMSAASE